MNSLSIPTGKNYFLPSLKLSEWLCSLHISVFSEYWGMLSHCRLQQQRNKSDYSVPSSVEDNIVWNWQMLLHHAQSDNFILPLRRVIVLGALFSNTFNLCSSLFYHGATALVGQNLLVIEDSLSLSDAPHSIGLLWTSDQPDAEKPTWKHTTPTRDRHPCPRWDLNPQSQVVSGRRPAP